MKATLRPSKLQASNDKILIIDEGSPKFQNDYRYNLFSILD